MPKEMVYREIFKTLNSKSSRIIKNLFYFIFKKNHT